jgi:hypothetical protein
MTTTTGPRHAWVDVIDIEDTVTLHLPDGPTQRLKPPPRRPHLDDTVEQPAYEVPQTIGIVGGPAVADPMQERFNQFCADVAPVPSSRPKRGRHRAGAFARLRCRFARLLRWIGDAL